MTSGNVEGINIVANSDDHESNHDEFYESESKSPVTQMDSLSLSNNTLDGPNQPILKSYDKKNLETKMRPEILIQSGTMTNPG